MNKILLTVACLAASFTFAQTYNNGALSTGSTANNGTAAPTGYTWS